MSGVRKPPELARPDESLEILIQLTADTSGGKETKREILGVNEALREAGKGARQYDKAIRETGRTPVQRNTFYEPIRVVAEPAAPR